MNIRSFITILIFTAFYGAVPAFSQGPVSSKNATPCSMSLMLEAELLKFYVEESALPQPVHRRIQMTHVKGNWYRVQYDDSKDAIALRKIHVHRIKKFLRLFQRLKENNGTQTNNSGVQLILETATCHDAIQVADEQLRILKRMKHVLKIWK